MTEKPWEFRGPDSVVIRVSRWESLRFITGPWGLNGADKVLESYGVPVIRVSSTISWTWTV